MLVVSEGHSPRRFFALFDKKLHNDGMDDCPYLVFTFCHGYRTADMHEDQIMDVVEVLLKYNFDICQCSFLLINFRLRAKVPNDNQLGSV